MLRRPGESCRPLVGRRGSVPRVERRVRLPGLVVSGRRGAHLAAHARGRYERGLRTDPRHGRHLMVSADRAAAAAAAAGVMVGRQCGPAGRTLHGHQFRRRHCDQAVAAVGACNKIISDEFRLTTPFTVITRIDTLDSF